MDMLRLCRSDNMGVQIIVPGLMLRLNKDQECYDFIKWWAITTDKSDYNWGDIDLPYLDIQSADVFEPVEQLCGPYPELSHLVCLCLLKTKLLIDLMRLEQSTSSLGSNVPREILDLIQSSVPRSPAISASRDIMTGNGKIRQTMIEQLKSQINVVYKEVQKANEHFWPAFADADQCLDGLPSAHSIGSREEMKLVLHYTYDVWEETPGATDFIVAKSDGDI